MPARGVVASVVASILFGIIALLAANVGGFSPEEVTGWRVVFVLLALAVVHIPLAQRQGLLADARKIFTSVKLILVFAVCTTIMWFQLWVFMWGPPAGHTNDIALGYFLLPLTMVVVGKLVFRDRMTRWQLAAVVAASVGVIAQLIISREIGWPVLLIAGLYPVYFGLRRWFGIDTKHVFLLEITALMVPSVFFIATGALASGSLPSSVGTLAILAVLSGVAMTLYILASTWLPLGLFGLLSYLEPVLLMVAAVMLGYALSVTDAFIYGPILLALVFLMIGGARVKRGEQAVISGQAVLTTNTIPIVVPDSRQRERGSA